MKLDELKTYLLSLGETPPREVAMHPDTLRSITNDVLASAPAWREPPPGKVRITDGAHANIRLTADDVVGVNIFTSKHLPVGKIIPLPLTLKPKGTT